MTIQQIKIWPDPILRNFSSSISEIDSRIRKIGIDLIDSVKFYKAAGLAAPQIGFSIRMFVINIPFKFKNKYKFKPTIFINPIILSKIDLFKWNEGCLSVPKKTGQILRFKNIIVQYLDFQGNLQIKQLTNFTAGCFQHELDHLNGILWIDHKKLHFFKKMNTTTL